MKRSQRMSRLLLSAAVPCALVVMALARMSPAPAEPGRPGDAALLEVAPSGQKQITVDFSQDPEAAAEALARADEDLDGYVVIVEGLGHPSPEERRTEDERSSRADQVSLKRCPSMPSTPREASTRAYLGCDSATGRETLGEPLRGPVEETLARALGAVLEASFPDQGWAAPEVKVSGRHAFVDFSSDLAEVSTPSNAGDGLLFGQNADFTAYSDSRLDTVTFTLDGDCMRFALASGGDMCPGAIDLDIFDLHGRDGR